jgi:hypothetical protein
MEDDGSRQDVGLRDPISVALLTVAFANIAFSVGPGWTSGRKKAMLIAFLFGVGR